MYFTQRKYFFALIFTVALAIIVTVKANPDVDNRSRRSILQQIQCYETGRFYRNPKSDESKIWSNSECAKYYLCLEGEVYEFRCSQGLLFDVNRQICDFKQNVHNCDQTAEVFIPKPLLDEADCSDEDHLGCADGKCLPSEYFCDGAIDCLDSSDEGYCDSKHDPNAAEPCDPSVCVPPECFCSKDGTIIPGDIEPKLVPQMIILTFDDAINFENYDLYTKHIFTPERKNPNGCPIKGTFFVAHQYTNYMNVQKLWNEGHEIGVHSITHRGPEEWWSKNATIEEWFDEMVGQANIINRFANVRMEDLRGMRVPFLRLGWNRQFLMMKEFGFVYDASAVAPHSRIPIWPYTLDFKIPHTCTGSSQNCPTRSYPGIWEMPINELKVSDYTCSMLDTCPTQLSGEDVYAMLKENFKRHYETNRAPYGLHVHTTWFKRAEYLAAYKKFIDEVLRRPDVYFVTNHQAIQWLRQPTPLNQLAQFDAWQCKPRNFEPNEIACSLPNTCKLHSRILQQDRYMTTCNECPNKYPWVRNEFGLE